MNTRTIYVAIATIIVSNLSFMAVAQDDMYFTSNKAQAKKAIDDYVPISYSDNERDVDEYNRRGSYALTSNNQGDDIIDFDGVVGQYPDSLSVDTQGALKDYSCTQAMSRFDDYVPDSIYWAGYSDGKESVLWYSPWYYGDWWYDPWLYSWYSPWHYGWYGYYGYYYPWHNWGYYGSLFWHRGGAPLHIGHSGTLNHRRGYSQNRISSNRNLNTSNRGTHGTSYGRFKGNRSSSATSSRSNSSIRNSSRSNTSIRSSSSGFSNGGTRSFSSGFRSSGGGGGARSGGFGGRR